MTLTFHPTKNFKNDKPLFNASLLFFNADDVTSLVGRSCKARVTLYMYSSLVYTLK